MNATNPSTEAGPKPVPLRPSPENIPQELKALPRWVMWRYMHKDGKWTKPPFRVDGKGYASSTDPATWSDYAAALATYHKGGFDGIGVALTTDFGVVGVDLDHCYNSKTKLFEPWATAIIDRFKSYTEASPSGTGVRIFLKGKLPACGHKKGNVEIYSSGRYLTVTGHALQKSTRGVESRQAEIDAFLAEHFSEPTIKKGASAAPNGGDHGGNLEDDALLSKAFAARNGAKIKALFDGDFSAYPSQSEADHSLCSMLAFWAQDQAQLDRLFRRSGLMRDKWAEPHGAQTYGERTIERAFTGRSEHYEPRRQNGSGVRTFQTDGQSKQPETWPKFLTSKEILHAPKDPARWIVADCLPAGGASVLVAKPKVGKTTIAADLSLSVARGESWLGRATQQSPVAYVFLDGPLTDIADTFVSLGLRETDPVFMHAGTAPPDAIAWILATVKDKGARLVIIDVLQKLCRFENINDYSEVVMKMEPLLETARAGNCHVMTLHHAKKDSKDDLDAAIGSTAIRGLAYTYLFAKRLANSDRRILSSDQRGGKNFGEIGIGFDKLTGRLYVQGTIDAVEIEEATPLIIKTLEDDHEQREDEIRNAVPMRGWIIGRALRSLVKKGDVERTGTGKRGNAYRYSLATPRDGAFSSTVYRKRDSSPSFHSIGKASSGLESEKQAQLNEKIKKDSGPKASDDDGTTRDGDHFPGGSGLESTVNEKTDPDPWDEINAKPI
jgi:hypothetical protein